MPLPDMPENTTSREQLRIAGGYGAPALGASPAGGLDIDAAGNLATDGDVTVRGTLAAGDPPQALTNTAGEVLGDRIAPATVDTPQLTDDAITPEKVDSTKVYEVGGIKLKNAWDGLVQLSGGAGQLLIATDTGTIRVSSSNTTSQLFECFRTSASLASPEDADFRVYSPGTTTIKHRLRGDGYASHAGDLYVGGNVSADSFTDRSPMYIGRHAIQLLRAVRHIPGSEGNSPRCLGDPNWAEVDHNTLGPIRSERKTESGVEIERDLNLQIQILCSAVLELHDQIENLQSR